MAMTSQEAAIAFLKMAGSGSVRVAYDKFVATNFIHHNQCFKGDRQSLMIAMEEASKTHPNKSIDIKHIYQDADTVVTHSLVTRQDPQAESIAVGVPGVKSVQNNITVESVSSDTTINR